MILTQQQTHCSHFALETFTLKTEQFSYLISPADWTITVTLYHQQTEEFSFINRLYFLIINL